MIVPAVIIGIIALAASLVASTASGIAGAAPTKGDKYRKYRLKQLETLAEEGFTAEQEEAIRSIGMGAVQTMERELRSRRGDALATLAGGATAADIFAAEAMDAERARDSRLQIENELKKADLQEREARRREQAQLIAQQEASQKQKRAAVAQAITGVAQDTANIASTTMTGANEDNAKGAAESFYGMPKEIITTSALDQYLTPEAAASLNRTATPTMGAAPDATAPVASNSFNIQSILASLTPEQLEQLKAMGVSYAV